MKANNQDVDFRPVTNKLEIELGNVFAVSAITYTLIERKDTGRIYIKIDTGNLVEHTGIFSKSLKSVHIVNFGGQVTDEKIFLPINFHYEYKTGGTNGHEIMNAVYDFETASWSFKD